MGDVSRLKLWRGPSAQQGTPGWRHRIGRHADQWFSAACIQGGVFFGGHLFHEPAWYAAMLLGVFVAATVVSAVCREFE